MLKQILALTFCIFLLAAPAEAKTVRQVLRTCVKYTTLPLFAVGGFAVGHFVAIVGDVAFPVSGVIEGVKSWDAVWYEYRSIAAPTVAGSK